MNTVLLMLFHYLPGYFISTNSVMFDSWCTYLNWVGGARLYLRKHRFSSNIVSLLVSLQILVLFDWNSFIIFRWLLVCYETEFKGQYVIICICLDISCAVKWEYFFSCHENWKENIFFPDVSLKSMECSGKIDLKCKTIVLCINW